MKKYVVIIIVFLLIIFIFFSDCIDNNKTDQVGETELSEPGEYMVTHINNVENGKIAVRIDVPKKPRYDTKAPIVVQASTWFVEKYDNQFVPFHLVYNPVDIGAISVSYLWPGKTDPETNISSEGVYDYGGPNCIAALRDVIRFAAGEIANVNGEYLNDLVKINAVYDNLGLFASSHAGVVATNVMAYEGELLQSLDYFVGRENPTSDEMYALELGYFDDDHNPIHNPYYDHKKYSPKSISFNYSTVSWVQNNKFSDGRIIFENAQGNDFIVDDRGPHMMGKRYFSYNLTQALMDNNVFTEDPWPEDVATPNETKKIWPYRITVHNYDDIGKNLPDLKVMLVFATYDHVQSVPDKPHIRQAYDGFTKTANLSWVRLNMDVSYVQSELYPNASTTNGFPDKPANTEPADWYNESESWGFIGKFEGAMTARTIPLAGISEMADRVQFNNWDDDLDNVLYGYDP
jgi:hypothetical protein